MKCKVDGCDREIRYLKQKVCQMHYFRFMRSGSYEVVPKERKITRNKRGYIMIPTETHPLRMKNNYVYEHRMVAYHKYGEDLPGCEICGKDLNWKTVHIDHIDEDIKNNQESNLRPLCRSCNVHRSMVGVLGWRGEAKMLTVGSISKTATEWARDDEVEVSHSTILRRVKSGMLPEEAIFGRRGTHKNHKNKKSVRKIDCVKNQ